LTPRSRKIATFGLVSIVGFAAGLVLRAHLEGTPDRAQAAAAMFEQWCVARLKGQYPMPGPPLVSYSGWPGHALWVDAETFVALNVTARRCTVSDEIALMTGQEQEKLRQIVTAQMAVWAPQLTEDPGFGLLLPGHQAWTSQHGLDDPLRWGIIFASANAQEPEWSTSLHVALPADPNQ
jgi:hypothetical protein